MQILGGKFKGKKLACPLGSHTRPTLGHIRQAIFNVLENRFKINFFETSVLDLYAGTGALGFEALSRGSPNAVFIDQASEVVAVLKQNLKNVPEALVLQKDIISLKKNTFSPFDLVFMDPPYDTNLISKTVDVLQQGGWVHPNSLGVVEIGLKEDLVVPNNCQIVHQKQYSSCHIGFIRFLSKEELL
ncbi:MAG: 16S rRNA (guanine(966)-N(2))-methyltransferase RsmD [Alphaproteobacteria bacterium]